MLTNILLGLILIILIVIYCKKEKKSTNQDEWIAIRKFLPDGATEINLTIPKVKRHEYEITPIKHCNPVPCSEKACEPTKPKRTSKRPDIDPTLWRAKFDEMLADKAKTLKSDNKVFADHHIDRQRFKTLATPEQRIRHAELQVLCKAKGREKIAETMGRGAKKKG